MARRGIELPDDLWMAVKVLAALRGQTIAAFLADLIRRERAAYQPPRTVTTEEEA